MLQGVKRVDGETIDIVVEDGVVADIAPAGTAAGGRVLALDGCYVSSGWIDLHVHAFPAFDPYGDEIDEIGVKQGVTTVVDAGSCGADRIADLAASRDQAYTNLYALLNVSRIGLERIDELSDLAWIDRAEALKAVRAFPDFIVGLKARISSSVVRDNGLEPLRLARAFAEETSLPLMVHVGSKPPRIQDILPLLAQGDVVTHYLNGKPNMLFDDEGQPIPELAAARARGVRLDVGHGTASFSFRVAEGAKVHGVHFDTISSDLYRGNRLNGPVYSLARVMTKFLQLGYPLADVVAGVTSRPAAWLRRPELGRIQVGDRANLTWFEIRDEAVALIDSEGEARMSSINLVAKGVIANGRFMEC